MLVLRLPVAFLELPATPWVILRCAPSEAARVNVLPHSGQASASAAGVAFALLARVAIGCSFPSRTGVRLLPMLGAKSREAEREQARSGALRTRTRAGVTRIAGELLGLGSVSRPVPSAGSCSRRRGPRRRRGQPGASFSTSRRRPCWHAILHRRDDQPSPLLRALLHRARKPPCPARRLHHQPDRRLGHPAGPQPQRHWPARADTVPVHDRDNKFSASFDEVFRSEQIKGIQTPIRAPQANADAGRFAHRPGRVSRPAPHPRRRLEHLLLTPPSHDNANGRTARRARPCGCRKLRSRRWA